jgi:predicted ArsR family transcriptional regulator
VTMERSREWDEERERFFRYWFSGLVSGLGAVDGEARGTILRECGKACADSYTAELFQQARRDSADLDGFLARLSIKFPEATYESVDAHTLRVSYDRCACDLVQCGLVDSPVICECSAYNLQENFARALGKPVVVTMRSSILQGAARCVFLVSLE